jgi:hypothetical protein
MNAGHPTVTCALKKFWEAREDELYAIGLENISAEYRKTAEKKQEIMLLSSRDLAALEEVDAHLGLISNDIFYQTGFKDGIKTLLKILIL